MEAHAYGIAIGTSLDPAEAERRIREALAEEGFGILTEIDVAATLAEKLGVSRPPYKILGACHPELAHQALGIEEGIGLLLPCNVVVYASGDGTVVAALEPLTMTALVEDPRLEPVAQEARVRLERALASLEEG